MGKSEHGPAWITWAFCGGPLLVLREQAAVKRDASSKQMGTSEELGIYETMMAHSFRLKLV